MNRRIACVAALLLLGCDHNPARPRPVSPELVAGCYALTLGGWTAAHEAPAPPAVIVLLDSIGTDLLEAGTTLVRPSPVDTNSFGYLAWWTRPVPDSLTVVFTTGFVGVELRLAWTGTAWAGQASAFTDVAPPVQATAAASLTALGFAPACGLRAEAL